MFMSLDDTKLDPDNQLMLVSISRQAGTELRDAAAEGALVSVWLPDYSTFDFNVVLLWIIAVGTFALAGICAANDCKTADELTLDDEVNIAPTKCINLRIVLRPLRLQLVPSLWLCME